MYTKDIIYAISILIITAWTIYKESKERRIRKATHIAANPKRCAEHQEALGRLDERLKAVENDVKEIKEILGDQGKRRG